MEKRVTRKHDHQLETTEENSDFLNYSIIENSIDGENIKLKLKMSRNQPKIILETLDQNIVNPKSIMDRQPSSRSLRRSSRIVKLDDTPRKSMLGTRKSLRSVPKVSYQDSPNIQLIEEINVTPKKKPARDLNSPSKLGFEHVSISTPGKRASVKRQLSEKNVEGSPTKKSIPATRTRSRQASTQQVYTDLEDLLAPMLNIKFDNVLLEGTPVKASSTNLKKTNCGTPQSQMKMIRNGLITPTMKNRQIDVVKASTPLNIVKEKLHVSYVPNALPCREKEFADIYNFVEGKLLDGCGGCIYISGVPGTGKTATVSEVIRQLQASAKRKDMPQFTYVSINGMRLTEPRQAYVEILRQLTGKTFVWEQAHSTLEEKFTKSKQKQELPIVLLVDELDILCTKRQDVVYNLLDWPTKTKAQLVVITIANTMDLPERLLMGRVTSRLGLTRLTFQAYTHKQLQEIVVKRLLGTNAFHSDALQLVARKVASVSGDARRALDICRRAAEVAESEGDNVLVSMQHVNEALNSMITQPKVRAIKRCSRLEQLILQAIAAEVERTGVDEIVFSEVYTMLTSVAAIDGFRMVSVSVALSAVKYLAACRLLLSDPKSNDFNQRLILNVNIDDIYYALHKNN